MKCSKLCKSCDYCVPCWGNKTKTGKRTISRYRCIKKGMTAPSVKQCEFYKERNKDGFYSD